jgi:Tfp pilus assembly protein PilE
MLAILIIVIVAGVLTGIESQTYSEDIFGNKMPG